MNLFLTGVNYVLKASTENLMKYIPGGDREMPPGSLKLSSVVVVMVTVQLLVTVSVSRAVIFFLLMMSGNVEKNPGPSQPGTLLSVIH